PPRRVDRERLRQDGVRARSAGEHSRASAHAVYGNRDATSNSSNDTEFADDRASACVARLPGGAALPRGFTPSTRPMYAQRLTSRPVLLMQRISAVQNNGALEVWWHNPTGHRWVVETDSSGMVIGAAGPFVRDGWHRFLRRNGLLNHHLADYVREHRRDFVRL